MVQNRQGKTRLAKWYVPYEDEEKMKLKGEVHRLVAPRDQKHQSNFVEVRKHLLRERIAINNIFSIVITRLYIEDMQDCSFVYVWMRMIMSYLI